MKKQIGYIIMAAALVSVPLFNTGCAVTRGRQSAGAYLDDKAITTKVKAKMVRDSLVKATDIDVTTFNGAVQLSGFVESQDQKDRAGELARQVKGVQQVYNNLIVQTGRPAKSDTSKSSPSTTDRDTSINVDTDKDKGVDVNVEKK